MNNQARFRASYSVLSTWSSGNWDLAIGMYFRIKKFTTEKMAAGSDMHKSWENEIIKTQCMPSVFGSGKLSAPQPELKLVAQLDDWLDLVGKIDCLDGNTIYEFKTGKTSSEIYANSVQPAIYGVLATLSGYVVDKAEIHHYDQYSKNVDMSIVWLTKKHMEDAYNWVYSLSSEMHNYILENDLYERFKDVPRLPYN